MSNYEGYEEEFQQINGTITRNIKMLPNFAGERKKVAIRETEKEIEEAEQLLRHLEIEASNHPERVRLQPKVKGYQTDIQKAKKDLQRVSNVSSNSIRDELMSGANQDYQVQFLDQRSGLLAGTEKLNNTTDRVQNAHRIALQTEQIGTEVLGNLHGQRNQIIKGIERLDSVDDNMKQSNTILTGMARRVVTNKIILLFIILVLLGIIGMIVYLKWIRPSG